MDQSSNEYVLDSKKQYKRTRSSLLSAMVHRLLQDRSEALTICSTVSQDPTIDCLHARAATIPYLVVTKISIQPPCLNFVVYSSHMLPYWRSRLDALLPVLFFGRYRHSSHLI